MLFPLDFVYLRSGVELPQVTAIDPDDIPLPYRSLLVHRTDMTLTLERHFGGRVALRPLATFRHGPWYFRRVLLAQEYTGRPVEKLRKWVPTGFGAPVVLKSAASGSVKSHAPFAWHVYFWTPVACRTR